MKDLINEIVPALDLMGIKGEITLCPNKYLDQVKVIVNGAYFGIWDTVKKTFVD